MLKQLNIWCVTIVLGLSAACATPMVSTLPEAPTPAQLAEFWVEPEPDRDLFWGVGGERLAPDPTLTYTVIEVKKGGFSRGYTVTGPPDREWSAKFPPEAQTEVVASRLLWGVGYHQPPIYLVENWRAEKAPAPNPQDPARFREKKPDLHGLDAEGEWSYFRNPFVGTPQLSGLLVLQVMLGNSDLKEENNRIYELEAPAGDVRRWFVSRDLGQSFGRTGIIRAPRNDVDVFEKTPYIRSVRDGRVRFDYRGRHGRLFDDISPADVRWISERLDRLTDTQWADAFRAGGYDPPTATRFIHRMKQKINEGLSLPQ